MTSITAHPSRESRRHPRADLYRHGAAELRASLEGLRSLLQPKKRVSASVWAEEHGYLSRESNSQPGKVRLYGYQRGLLDAMSDPSITQVSVLKAARVGYTRMITLALGYYIEHDPSPILLAQPTVSDAEDFSGGEVLPMLRDTTCLAALRRDAKRGEAQDKISDIVFRNGATLKLRGAASDDAFRRISTRINIGDEIDGDGWSSDRKGSQGDKLKLMATRGETFWNSKLIIGSTPLWQHSSRIYREWLRSDQRRYFVPCPGCGEMQFLEFGGKDSDNGLKWSVDDEGQVTDAWYVCRANGCVIEESAKHAMDAKGEWRPTAKPKTPGHAGFHLWTGMSLFPKAGWRYIAREFLEARRKPELLQPFVNLRLGEPFVERKDDKPELTVDTAKEHLEVYPAEVPDDVVLLTVGVDVQTGDQKSDDPAKGARVEVSIWGWGAYEESWLISHTVIPGEMSNPATHQKLDDHIWGRPFKKLDGTELVPQAVAIDLGGHYTPDVKAWARGRSKRNAWAVKGKNLAKGTRSASIWPRAASRDRSESHYMLDTQLAKDVIGRRMKAAHDAPDRMHFPAGTPDRYFEGLTVETRVQVPAGYYWHKPNPKAYGEPLDCLVYAYSALQGLKMTSKRWRNLDAIGQAMKAARAGQEPETPKPRDRSHIIRHDDQSTEEAPKPAAPSARPRVKTVSSFMKR